MIGFITGLFIGGSIGFMTAAICHAARGEEHGWD